MFKLLSILWNSFRMALQELKVNKLRTFLSLFGITIGIFCIIGVLATVDSLKRKVRSDIQSFGNNTIYIDKWEYAGGNDYPWWKYYKRPVPKFSEMKFLKEKSQLASNICFFVSATANTSFEDSYLSRVNIYGVTEAFNNIQTIEVLYGRYFAESEFMRGTPAAVIGFTNAEELFGSAERAVDKEVTFHGKKVVIIGVIKKQGKSIVGGFDYDECLLIPYQYFASIYDTKYGDPFIMVQAK